MDLFFLFLFQTANGSAQVTSVQAAVADTFRPGRKLPCKFPLLCREYSGEADGPFGKVTGGSDAPHLKRADCDAADLIRLVSRPQRFPQGSSELADPTVIEYIKSSVTQGFCARRHLLVSALHYVPL